MLWSGERAALQRKDGPGTGWFHWRLGAGTFGYQRGDESSYRTTGVIKTGENNTCVINTGVINAVIINKRDPVNMEVREQM